MKFEKAPPALVERFTSLLPRHPDAEPRQMFGYPCCFVRGNFWVGLHEANVVIRLPDGLHEQFPELAGALPFDPMGGRPMKGWFVVPARVVKDTAKLTRLLETSLAQVVLLPPKAKKPAAAKAKKARKA